MQHFIVCSHQHKYSAWPANGGMWLWNDEILVSYNRADFDPTEKFHRISKEGRECIFSRSLDGGVTWAEVPFDNNIYKTESKPIPPGGLDFSKDGFVMRVGLPAVTIETDLFITSYDKGDTWHGPYKFPVFEFPLTSRTSYHIEGSKVMRAFMSYSLPKEVNPHGYTDKAFVALTEDGGESWKFVGAMTTDAPRSVMPQAVRLKDGTLVASMRRRMKTSTKVDDVWIEVKRSDDDGKTWHSATRAADTYNFVNPANTNGNPPAMCILDNDHIVLAYGRREPGASSLYFKISKDGGRNFTNEKCLRYVSNTEDFGYPRIVARADGKCVATYYIATADYPVQHIEATIFDPLA